jgi:hypothetical protein
MLLVAADDTVPMPPTAAETICMDPPELGFMKATYIHTMHILQTHTMCLQISDVGEDVWRLAEKERESGVGRGRGTPPGGPPLKKKRDHPDDDAYRDFPGSMRDGRHGGGGGGMARFDQFADAD